MSVNIGVFKAKLKDAMIDPLYAFAKYVYYGGVSEGELQDLLALYCKNEPIRVKILNYFRDISRTKYEKKEASKG
jgi:hypothetical protein